MATIICPWCQFEIIQEAGAEPEKYCPVCENELDGYRTITVDLEPDEADLEDSGDLSDDEDEFDWSSIQKDLREKSEDELKFLERSERLLDEQDTVPECPHCREYMVEAGEQAVAESGFRPRLLKPDGPALLQTPFILKMYVCPACFAVSYGLPEADRLAMMRRLGSEQA